MDARKIATETVEAIRRLSASMSDDVREAVFSEIAKQLAPKKRAKPQQARPLLNALGKPYGSNYDPNYKMRYKAGSTAHLYYPYSDKFRRHLT